MELRNHLYAVLGRSSPNKGEAAFAAVGAVLGGGIAAHFFPGESALEYCFFALTVIGCAILGAAVSFLLPRCRVDRIGETAKSGLYWLAGLASVLMAMASVGKLAQTGNPAFIIAVTFFGSGAITLLGNPRRVTTVIGALGLAISSAMLFFFTGEIIGIIGAAFCTWAAMQALTRNV